MYYPLSAFGNRVVEQTPRELRFVMFAVLINTTAFQDTLSYHLVLNLGPQLYAC